MSEYLTKFFPIYNCDTPRCRQRRAPRSCARRSFLVAPGNHAPGRAATSTRYPRRASPTSSSGRCPPNGPHAASGAANTPTLRGSEPRRRAFLDRAGAAYPRMANYSFDYGDAHWTVLDTNPYADWTDPASRAWLGAATPPRPRARPGGSSPSTSRRSTRPRRTTTSNRTRLLADLFDEAHGSTSSSAATSTTISDRTYPMRFRVKPAADGRTVEPSTATSTAAGRSTPPSTARAEPAPTASFTSSPAAAPAMALRRPPERRRRVPASPSPRVSSPTCTRSPSSTSTPMCVTVRQVSRNDGMALDRFVVVTRPAGA